MDHGERKPMTMPAVAGFAILLVAPSTAKTNSAVSTTSTRNAPPTLMWMRLSGPQPLTVPLPAELGGVAFASHYQSATREAMLGGDLYDLTMTQYGPRFIIGDVKGKGLDAVGRCAAVLAIFRELAFAEPDLARLAEKMDAGVSRDMEIEDFVTVILAEFGPGEVRIVNCGHQPPVKIGADCDGLEIMAPSASTPPLGLHPGPCRQDVALKPGDRLLFYTDGLVETRDRAGRFFELDGRVAEALALPGLDAAIQGVVKLLLEHGGDGLADDVLLVLGEPVAS
jgi:phosphoserine phosphatase RsbU/P